MQIEHHDLIHELPEFKDAIHDLKMKNQHFAKLFDAYHTATDTVEGFEARDIPVGDVSFEDMKKKRLKLKDELYAMLVAHKN
jgi:uncharacterized protein YdcH (DUF465 family)